MGLWPNRNRNCPAVFSMLGDSAWFNRFTNGQSTHPWRVAAGSREMGSLLVKTNDPCQSMAPHS